MKSILVVDDDENCRKAIADLFEHHEYDIIQASDDQEALAVLSNVAVDLLITDTKMPKIDGMELSDKAKHSFPNLEIIFISEGGVPLSNGTEHDLQCLENELASIEHVIKKPCNPDELINLVGQLLDG